MSTSLLPGGSTREWRRIREAILIRDGHKCRWRGCSAPATDVDHIRRREDGGNDDAANLRSLCHDHHVEVAQRSTTEPFTPTPADVQRRRWDSVKPAPVVETVARAYAADFDVKRSKRIIEGRAVPYGHAERVSDDGRETYLEEWAPGAFARYLNPSMIGRVAFQWSHDDYPLGMNKIGKTVDLDEQPDGLYGTWRVHESDAGDEILARANTGELGGLSISAGVQETTNRAGVKVRSRARLEHVALVEDPAFTTARVTAVRSRPASSARVTTWQTKADELRRRRDQL